MRIVYIHTCEGRPVNFLPTFHAFSHVGPGEIGGSILRTADSRAQIRRERHLALKNIHPMNHGKYGHIRVQLP